MWSAYGILLGMKNLFKILLLLALGIEADAEITNVLQKSSFGVNKVQTIDSWASENGTASNGFAAVSPNNLTLNSNFSTNGVSSTNLFETVNGDDSNLVAEVVSEEVVVAKPSSPYYDFNRYKIILERKPFGEVDALALAPEPVKVPVKLPNFAKHYSMCAITDSYGEIMVGFIDKAKKGDVKYYYLRVGESQDGITLVEADYANESAKLSKDGREFWIDMTGPKLSNTSSSSSAQPLIARNSSNRQANESYSSRLRKQRESRIKVESRIRYPKENMTKEEITEHLRNLNMELIRAQGSKGPPLPIQLTPEDDAQLVSEGVLPSADAPEEEVTQ